MESIEDALRKAVGCWNVGDLDGYLELYDDKIKLHGYSAEPLGKGAVISHYKMLWAALATPGSPNPRLDIGEVLATGHRLACRFTMSGVHQGPFLRVPASGRRCECPGITIMHFAGLRVVERWSMVDRLSQLIQIGAFIPPNRASGLDYAGSLPQTSSSPARRAGPKPKSSSEN